MPKYRLVEPAFIDDRLWEAGTEIEFSGKPGEHMIPLDPAARAAVSRFPPQKLDENAMLPIGTSEA